MARKPIDIGAIGNDGTGDSIRDAFRKVNDNFRELYSSLGLGERLRFIGLDDTPESYVGFENSLLTVGPTEENVTFRRLVAGSGVQIDFSSNQNEILINNLFSDISGDPRPNLGGALNAESGAIRYPIGNLLDLSDPSQTAAAKTLMQISHGITAASADRLAANKGYVDTKIALAGVNAIDPDTGSPDTRFGRMTGPLILSRNPVSEDDITYDGLIAATKRYVDSSGFGSAVNLYVATTGLDDREFIDQRLQGRALSYAFRTIEAALKKAEELVLDAPLEIGPYAKILTYGSGANQCFLQAIDFTNGIPLNPATFDLFMSSDSVELASSGNLYLPGDILEIIGGTFTEAIKIQVLSVNVIPGTGGRGSIATFRTLTSGVYSVLPGSTALPSSATSSTGGSTFGSGATFNITYRINNIVVGNAGGSGYGLVSITFQGGGGGTGASARAIVIGGVIQSVTVINKGSGYTTKPNIVASLPRFFIFTGGQRTDFTGNLGSSPEALRTRDIREGLLLRGETSGALGLILAHTGQLSNISGFEQSEIFDVDIIQGEFSLNETISYGDVTKPIQICVFVEAGIYEENLPLKIPQNVAIIGDEFRRTIVRPRKATEGSPLSGMSSSPWAFVNFRRDPTFDGMRITEQSYGYHYLSDPTIPIYPFIDNDGNRRSTAELLQLNRSFIKNQIIGWIANQINIAGPGDDFEGFEYDIDLCKRDVGLIIDAMSFDLKFGGYARTVSAALKYFQGRTDLGNSLVAITTQLSQTLAAIAHINTLAQDVIANIRIANVYNSLGIEFDPSDPDNTITIPFPQVIDQAFVAEPGSSTIISELTNIILDIIENSGAANYPLDNIKMDMFLCNDANIIRAITGQGQGGFMMVLDPTGQILTKSPYCQESASFSQSTGFKTFAGGMFVDGFTGNQRFFIESTESVGSIVNISGLLRPPETPCSFIVSDIIYRVNYIRNYDYGIIASDDPLATTEGGYGTAQLILDETTPFFDTFTNVNCIFSLSFGELIITVSGGHDLQIRAIVQFKTSGTLPSGLQTFKDYYVIGDGFTETTFKISEVFGIDIPVQSNNTGTGTHSFRRVFEILMPGNRSMLSNDYTQVNDLGYGLVVANGGLTEAVSMFTYYCEISYFALTGGQIRSIGGSSSHGNYALVAQGSDPLEVPTPTSIYHKLSEGATVFSLGAEFVNNRGDQRLFVIYDDYMPLQGSELEVNHNNIITRYFVNQVQMSDLATKRVSLGISSAGGLEFAIPHGQRVVIRQNSFLVLTGDVVNVATRPSTALVLNDSSFVYRILEFNDYGLQFDQDNIEIASINTGTGLITTTIPHRQQEGYQIRIQKLSGTLPNVIIASDAGPPEVVGDVYYIVADGLTNTTFKIATTKTGSALDLSTGGSYTGLSKVVPYGLSLTQLRENYAYTVMDLFRYQPFRTPGSLISGTVVPASDWITTATTYPIHTQIMIQATAYPADITAETFYYVISDDFVSNTRFAIARTPPIFHSQIGIGNYNTVTQRITGLRSTANITEGMRVIAVTSITGVSASHVGTAVTLTFTARPKPPFILGQSITVSGFGSQPNYNGTFVITGVTTTTLQYTASVAPTGVDAGGTISTPSSYGTLPTDATVAVGGVISSTEIEITGSGGSPLTGTVAFNVEGVRVDFTTAGTGVTFGNVIGDQGQTQVAVTKLPQKEVVRVTNSDLAFDGIKYTVTNYQELQDYGLITLSQALVTSAISYISPIALKSGVAVPSPAASGTLTIRIALVRVTSHDFLEIGTGSYADTNYPNDIFGKAVNDFNSVPLYVTDFSDTGETITRSQVQERDVGRVFFVTTDQYGNFSVGPFFKVDQGTGTVTFSASIALSQLDGLGFKRGATISEFSTDDRMLDELNDSVPTEAAVAGYVSRRLGTDRNGNPLLGSSLIPANTGGFLPLAGNLAMKGNVDMANFRVRNLGVPTLLSDAARLDSINLTNLKDDNGNDLFDFTNISSGQIVALTGDNNVMSNFTPVGDVVFDLQIGDSTLNVIRTDISPNVIVNADINSSAGIVQSKLSMNAATTRANAIGITQADRGLASFDDAQFTATNGWLTVKDNGLTLAKLPAIGTQTVLGNSSTTVPTNVSTIAFSTVVDGGGAVKKSQYSSGVGYLKRTNATIGNFTLDAHYSIIQDSSTAEANRLVIRDANGDFASRYITVDQLILKTTSTGNYKVLEANEETTTRGFTNIFGYGGGGGSVFAGIQIGAGATNQRNLYNNDSHQFRSQNGSTVYGTLTSTGLTVGASGSLQPISASSITVTAITTGAEATTGTVTGRWTLVGTSRWEATYAADLAEYYEGDQEYEVGTVLIFGGDKEVTISSMSHDKRIAGVVSDTAAYSMYGACPGFKNQIALQGRVPCKVKGKIFKGDLLVTSDTPGVAIASEDPRVGTIIGKAVENYDSELIGMITISVGRT
jgi:hypothetical protein